MYSPAGASPRLSTTRNGRLQACEPCRKRKLACDHMIPVCSRCQKREQTSDCVYLSAPPTNNLRGIGARSRTRLSSQLCGDQSLGSLDHSLDATPQVQSIPSPSILVHDQVEGSMNGQQGEDAPSIQLRPWADGLNRTTLPDQTLCQTERHSSTITQNEPAASDVSMLFSDRCGFLGSTSFSSIFWENQDNLSCTPWRATLASVCDQSPMVASAQEHVYESLEHGSEALNLIPTKECCDVLFASHNRWMNFGISECYERMWQTYGHLIQSRRETSYTKFAQDLHRNSSSPFLEPQDPQAYIDGFTGENIRWEALGMLFINCKSSHMYSRAYYDMES